MNEVSVRLENQYDHNSTSIIMGVSANEKLARPKLPEFRIEEAELLTSFSNLSVTKRVSEGRKPA